MPKVRDYMTREVVAVSRELPLRDALELLAQRHIGGAVVVAAGKPIGVISAADLLAFQASSPIVPSLAPHEIEQAEAEPLGEWEEDVEAAATYYTELWPDLGADITERFQAVGGPEWDLLSEHTVGEAMSRGVLTIPPDADVADAARKMIEAKVHRLLVVEGGRLGGIITTWDLMRVLAQRD